MQCIGPCGYMVLIVCCLPLPSTVAKIYTLPLKSIPGYAAGGGVHFALLGLRDLEFMGIEKETIFIPIGKGKGSDENPLLLGDIADKRFRLLRHMLPFRGLSVCLFVTFAHCAQTAEDSDTIPFAYDSSHASPNLAYAGRPFLPKFCPKVTHSLSTSASETFDGKLRRIGYLEHG